MCVCPLITAASHIGITQQRYLRVHSNTAIVLNFADFPKNASFKSYGVICLPRAAPPSYIASVERKRRKTTEGGSECEGRRECAKEVNCAYIMNLIHV